MSRRDPWNIVQDVENEFDVEIEEYPPDILCDGEMCRHSECDCWDRLRAALSETAEKQQMEVAA